MARTLTTKFIGGNLVPVILCDDFDFAGLGNPSNLNTIVEVIHTTAPGVFSVVGYYYWNAGVWTLMDPSSVVGPQYPSAVTLAQSAVPAILVPSGTVATNGVITLGTALPTTYAAAWIYLPAGAVVGGAAGLYYCVFSSATVGQVYTNYSAALTQLIPAIPTGALVPAVGSNSAYTTVVAIDSPLACIDVPGLLMGLNGRIRVTTRVSVLNNANVKTEKFTFGGSSFGGFVPLASVAGAEVVREISNRGNAASQFSLANAALTSETSGTPTYTTVNTAVDALLAITGNLATATDYFVLESLAVEVLPN
jgi:hypothetical protein